MVLAVKTKTARPKFYDYFKELMDAPQTERTCHTEGCDEPARNVGGHYVVVTRWVRVWVCDQHRVGNPNQELPVPANIQYALQVEAAFMEEQAQRAKIILHTERSVKPQAPTGHGDPIPGDRVKSWRWGA